MRKITELVRVGGKVNKRMEKGKFVWLCRPKISRLLTGRNAAILIGSASCSSIQPTAISLLQAEIMHTLDRPRFVGTKNVFRCSTIGTATPADKGYVYPCARKERWIQGEIIESKSVPARVFAE